MFLKFDRGKPEEVKLAFGSGVSLSNGLAMWGNGLEDVEDWLSSSASSLLPSCVLGFRMCGWTPPSLLYGHQVCLSRFNCFFGQLLCPSKLQETRVYHPKHLDLNYDSYYHTLRYVQKFLLIFTIGLDSVLFELLI